MENKEDALESVQAITDILGGGQLSREEYFLKGFNRTLERFDELTNGLQGTPEIHLTTEALWYAHKAAYEGKLYPFYPPVPVKLVVDEKAGGSATLHFIYMKNGMFDKTEG